VCWGKASVAVTSKVTLTHALQRLIGPGQRFHKSLLPCSSVLSMDHPLPLFGLVPMKRRFAFWMWPAGTRGAKEKTASARLSGRRLW
jgi:hypothetical protein